MINNFAVSVHVCLNLQFQPLLKVTSLSSAQKRDLLTHYSVSQQLRQALKPWKSPIIWSTIHFSHPMLPSLKMWTDVSSTGYGRITHNLRITQSLGANVLELMRESIAIKDFKLSNICLLETDNRTTRLAINKWRSPSKKYFDNSSGIVSSEECAHKSISNTNSPQCNLGFIKQGQTIPQEMSLKAMTFN